MKKNFSKILATILSVCMIATFCVVPITTASADTPSSETYETATQIGYADFVADDTGNAVTGSSYTMGTGGRVLRYTSATFSTVVKFRWQATGSNPATAVSISFDIDTLGGTNISYPFGFDISSSDGTSDINRIRFQPGGNVEKILDAPIMFGSIHDIEMGRLKVLTGSNAGKYYFYLKFDGEMIGEAYVATDENDQYISARTGTDHNVTMVNKILIGTWGRGGADKILPSYSDETYYDYDEITMSDLTKTAAGSGSYNANTGSMSGACTFSYPYTSDTYSAVLKYRWTPGIDDADVSTSFERNGLNPTHPFGYRVEKSTASGASPNGAWHYYASDDSKRVKMQSQTVAGTSYIIELGRKKVATGTNAGKYYGYLKVDGQLLGDAYVTVDNDGTYQSGGIRPTIGNEILFYSAGANNAKFTDVQTTETYEMPEYIGYPDLKSGGNYVTSGGRNMGSGNEVFTYDADSYSNIVRFVWKAGVTGTSDFKVAFDTKNGQAGNTFGFAVKASSGASSIDTIVFQNGYALSEKQLDSPILQGDEHNIEIGRIKVTSGIKTGKYYYYLKFDGELIGEKYIAVDANNQYDDNGTAIALSKSIVFTTYGRGGADHISELVIPETYETATEIRYNDLKDGGNYLSGTEKSMGSGSKQFTFDSDTLSTVIKLRWKSGATNANDFKLSFDEVGDQIADPFGFGVKADSGAAVINKVVFQNGLNTASKVLDAPVNTDDEHNIELGRLKVLTGSNTGKYYVYLKFDDELIGSAYVKVNANNQYTASNNTVTMGNTIRFVTYGRGGADKIKEFFEAETYAPYDQVSYSDLLLDGVPVSANGTVFSNTSKTFTYNATSPTYSAIFKYRWKVGSKSNFHLSFDKYGEDTMSYMFGAKLEAAHDSYTNGEMWLRPAYGTQRNLPSALASGTSHNIEFARLKVVTGSNTGKYYTYIKIDDVLIDESYVDANVVDSEGNYLSNSGKEYQLSNEILFNFWGSNENVISSYFVPVDGHVGVRGDFNNDGIIIAEDITSFINVLLGATSIEDLADADIADFNNDGKLNIIDLISMKRYLAPINTITRSGNIVVGTQEHLLEDETKTSAYIAEATATLGADAYRLSRSISSLFRVVDAANNVEIKTENMTQFKEMVAALKAQGIDEILYVTDAFLLPYGYSNTSTNHNKTVPTMGTEDYNNWLKVNANAFSLLATEVPEIKFFEPYNEVNTTGTRLEKPGIGWDAEESLQASYKFTVSEKAAIMADLCWNVSKAVKSVNPANQVTTPSVCVGSGSSNIQSAFLNSFYLAIESGAYPSNKTVGDKRIDNFFTILNLHTYPSYGANQSSYTANINTRASDVTAAYNIARNHNDGGSRVWITETGMSTGDGRNLNIVGDAIYATLNKINNDLTFVDTVIIYKLADISSDIAEDEIEKCYGLFYSGDELDYEYQAKPSAKAVYRFTHGGSTDYSAIDALVAKYAN